MRDPDVLRRQVADLTAYYQSALTAEHAASLAPGGSYIPAQRHGNRRQDARFTVVVHALADVAPLHVRLYAGGALRQLPLEQRQPLELVLLSDCTRTDTAAALGISGKTLQRRMQAGLEAVARALWNDAGEMRIPPGANKNGRHA